MHAVAEQPEVLEIERTDPGIEILVEMAERREIDPWDIDIIQVTNGYLQRLDERGMMNLPVTGKMFFYAAVLLRMKAEALARQCDILPGLDDQASPGEWDGDGGELIQLSGRAQR